MENEKKVRYYPIYATPILQVKGLYFYEWICMVVVGVVPTFVLGPIGLFVGGLLSATMYAVLIRTGTNRMNFYQTSLFAIKFILRNNVVMKKPRGEEDVIEIEGRKKGKKKRVSKRNRNKKERNMQDFFPFSTIEDNFITMENGNVFLFLKIQSAHLNFLSHKEVENMMNELGKQFGRSMIVPNYFIQDSVFDIADNIEHVKKVTKNASDFIQALGEDHIDILESKQKEASKKATYLFIEITKELLKTKTREEVASKIKITFRENLSVMDTSKEELKQMISIFANRIFTDVLPDDEMPLSSRTVDTGLIRKKKQKAKEVLHPAVYEFKDLITPITAQFKPSSGRLGSNHIKVYGVSSFISATTSTSILSEISSIKGVTTTVRCSELNLKSYKNHIKLSMKSKNGVAKDEIDEVDMNLEKADTKSGYRRLREQKQSMYYVSVLFELNANSEKELEKLEEQFKTECDKVDVTIDPLHTLQREGFESVNPIGSNKLDKWLKQNISSESLANLYPFEDMSLMDTTGLPIGTLTDKEDLVIFDPFEEQRSNHNILILGYSGTGKTTLLWIILQNEIIQGSFVRNLDVEGICKDFAERLGGINLNIAGNNEYCINPLQIRIPDEVKSGLVDDYISEVRNFMSIYKSGWTAIQLDLFEHYVSKIYKQKGITNNSDFSSLKENDYPLFGDIYSLIKEDKNNFNVAQMLGTPELLGELILGMESMVHGADAKLFNRYTYLGDSNEQQFINFDLSDMMNSALDRKLAQWSNVFTYISQFVNKNMDRERKIVVAIDELHSFFKQQYAPILDVIEAYARRFRKYLASLITASQTVEEFNSDVAEIKDKIKPLFSQPAMKFLFHLGDVKYEDTKDLLNLKELEMNALKDVRKGKCLMKMNNKVYDIDVMMPEWFASVKKDVNKR